MGQGIADILAQFDGKQVNTLESLAGQLISRGGDVNELVALSTSSRHETQIGATWLLKRLHEAGVAFSTLQVEELLRLLMSVVPWQAKLHLLQMLTELELPAGRTEALFTFLKQNSKDPNKFVRAWSYNGLYVVGERFHRYRAESLRLLDEAELDTAPSVRARVRRLRKPGPGG